MVTLCEISRVAASCCSTAAAMPMVRLWISATLWVMVRMKSTATRVEFCMLPICTAISSVAFAVCVASVFTSEATTAKPRPDSPARAASIVALSASRLVWSAIARISSITEPMRCAASARPATSRSDCLAASAVSAATVLVRCVWLRNLPDRRAQLLGRGGDRLRVAGGADRCLRCRHGFRRGGRRGVRQGFARRNACCRFPGRATPRPAKSRCGTGARAAPCCAGAAVPSHASCARPPPAAGARLRWRGIHRPRGTSRRSRRPGRPRGCRSRDPLAPVSPSRP